MASRPLDSLSDLSHVPSTLTAFIQAHPEAKDALAAKYRESMAAPTVEDALREQLAKAESDLKKEKKKREKKKKRKEKRKSRKRRDSTSSSSSSSEEESEPSKPATPVPIITAAPILPPAPITMPAPIIAPAPVFAPLPPPSPAAPIVPSFPPPVYNQPDFQAVQAQNEVAQQRAALQQAQTAYRASIIAWKNATRGMIEAQLAMKAREAEVLALGGVPIFDEMEGGL